MARANPDDQLRLLVEIARWTREMATPIVRERVERALDSDGKRRVYDAIASGANSVARVERITGVNHGDVRTWLDAWEAQNLVEPGSSPPKAIFTLEELGILPPPPREPRRSASRS